VSLNTRQTNKLHRQNSRMSEFQAKSINRVMNCFCLGCCEPQVVLNINTASEWNSTETSQTMCTVETGDSMSVHLQSTSVVNQLTQTLPTLSSKSPRKVALRKKIHCLQVVGSRRKKKLILIKDRLTALKKRYQSKKVVQHSVDSILNAASTFLPTDGLRWLEMQLKLAKKSPKGRRYSDYAKLLALNLYSHGPKSYRFLSNMFTLPTKSTLSLWLQSMQVRPGISDELLHATSIRVNTLQDRDRVCALMIDEMSIKTSSCYDKQSDVIFGFHDCGETSERESVVATSALVFMVRGLSLNWKQPVGYVLTKSACKGDIAIKLLYQFLDRLHAIGLIVKVVISDQGRKSAITDSTDQIQFLNSSLK
jgi:hypothetical protein